MSERPVRSDHPCEPEQARKSQRSSTDIDRLVGHRVRQRRIETGMSQEKLAEAIGVSLQQLQKYEAGANRIGASRLFRIAEALDTPIIHFFGTDDDLDECEDKSVAPLSDALLDDEIRKIVKAFGQIDDHYLRTKIVDMLEAYSYKYVKNNHSSQK